MVVIIVYFANVNELFQVSKMMVGATADGFPVCTRHSGQLVSSVVDGLPTIPDIPLQLAKFQYDKLISHFQVTTRKTLVRFPKFA